jgi:hypothetical protein
MNGEYNYYEDELNKVVDTLSEYPLNIQIKNDITTTKWLTLNNESAKVLVRYLMENYDCSQ